MASSWHYYNVEVNVSPDNAGKIYINETETTTATGKQYGDSDSELSSFLNLRAEANDGYQFVEWSNGLGSNPNITVEIWYKGTERNPTQFSYTAFFEEQTGLVQVQVAQGQAIRGSATIDNTANKNGDIVKLTANPDYANGVKFLGWRKDGETTYKTDNPYSLTVSDETRGTYYAYFSEPQEKLYCRIKNKNGKYLMVYGNGEATNHTRDYHGTRHDGFYFTNSLKMVSEDEARGNPMTVFLRTGASAGQGVTEVSNLEVCGVKYTDLVGSEYPLTIRINETSNGKVARIFHTFNYKYNNNNIYLNSYLRDGGKDGVVMQTIEDTNITEGLDWEVIILNEDTKEGSFGAYTKEAFTQGGKFYTTMFTSFPYQLLDGVKAYYLPIHDINDIYTAKTNTAHFKDIPTGNTVPKNSAVVLESPNPYNDKNNRLLPLTGDGPKAFESNFLQGYNYVSGTINTQYVKNQYVSNDINNPDKFILSQLNGRLGWYYSKADHMTPNKAYMDVSSLDDYISNHPEAQQQARTIKFTFGENNDDNEATGIIAHEFSDEVDGPLFDLNGRRVTNGDAYGLKKGIYISNGKKIVVK